MKTVRVSEEVYAAIAKRGNFGESVDDVLRRVMRIENVSGMMFVQNTRKRVATKKMSTGIRDEMLFVRFEDGSHNEWPLPQKDDKAAIRSLKKEAGMFAEIHGATTGQIYAVYKVLTANGYHITK